MITIIVVLIMIITLHYELLLAEFGSPFGANIYPIVVNVSYQTEDRLHIKIFDPNNKRYEIPTK